MGDYIEQNIEDFCKDILNDTLHIYKRQWSGITTSRRITGTPPTADLWVRGKSGKGYIIELKNPTSPTEAISGITQLLNYGLMDKKAELYLITSVYTPALNRIVDAYKLPINIIWMRKKMFMRVVDIGRENDDLVQKQ